ncbi:MULTISPECIES: YiiX/YebB-like N1pC/P60 family cysteine hydrolase [Lacrimispora]|jgi:hypothetical protein|uniref:YiiX/YebB-like N1pC/P60 family cysteine hydrolase n=1 Tax=Lacrimispora TaxID=2719231 RepID=UPI0011415244|nr:YiiX/YebB-like N1pC/P60 family cysteine hydrolase [Lacrimispora amygdalina]MDK2966591.1 hypothetical protein [Lacrimispora sp.]
MKIKKISHFKCLLLAIVVLLSSGNVAFAKEKNSNVDFENQLINSYEELMEYAQSNNIPLDMSLETFLDEYKSSNYTKVSDYVKTYYNVLEVPPEYFDRRSGGGSKWYYNTGTSLPKQADYSSYKLLNNVRKGDVIYEANGGFGITGHAAIVEGKFYDSIQKQYYIRIIEAIDVGVVRSVLDDERLADKDTYIFHVKEATESNINNAVDFAKSQLGKGYSIDFAKDTSASEKDWYCSELVWAAYYNQGINIETKGSYNEPGITPRDIKNCSKLLIVPIK